MEVPLRPLDMAARSARKMGESALSPTGLPARPLWWTPLPAYRVWTALPPPLVLLLSPFIPCALLRASWAQSSRSPGTPHPAALGGWDVRGVMSERLLRLRALALAPHVLVGRASGDLAVPPCAHLGSRPAGHLGKSTWWGRAQLMSPGGLKMQTQHGPSVHSASGLQPTHVPGTCDGQVRATGPQGPSSVLRSDSSPATLSWTLCRHAYGPDSPCPDLALPLWARWPWPGGHPLLSPCVQSPGRVARTSYAGDGPEGTVNETAHGALHGRHSVNASYSFHHP